MATIANSSLNAKDSLLSTISTILRSARSEETQTAYINRNIKVSLYEDIASRSYYLSFKWRMLSEHGVENNFNMRINREDFDDPTSIPAYLSDRLEPAITMMRDDWLAYTAEHRTNPLTPDYTGDNYLDGDFEKFYTNYVDKWEKEHDSYYEDPYTYPYGVCSKRSMRPEEIYELMRSAKAKHDHAALEKSIFGSPYGFKEFCKAYIKDRGQLLRKMAQENPSILGSCDKGEKIITAFSCKDNKELFKNLRAAGIFQKMSTTSTSVKDAVAYLMAVKLMLLMVKHRFYSALNEVSRASTESRFTDVHAVAHMILQEVNLDDGSYDMSIPIGEMSNANDGLSSMNYIYTGPKENMGDFDIGCIKASISFIAPVKQAKYKLGADNYDL